MNPTLLKFGFYVLVSALLFGGFTNDAKAQELQTVWERSDRTGAENPKPDWFSAGFVRGIGYGTVDGNERIYAADRTNNTIRVIDAETGDDITPSTPFDLTGVSGGTYALNDLEISDDGIIFLGNLTTSAESPFRLYWWTSEGGAYADSLTINVDGRVGDKFSVVGSVADNTIEVWMPVASSDPGIVHVATTDDQGANWTIDTITLSSSNVAIPGNADAYPLMTGGSSDFYIAGNGSSPKRYTSTGEYVENSQFPATNYTGSRNGIEAFQIDGSDYLSVYTYRPDGVDTGNKTGRVYIYDVTDPLSPVTVGETPLLGDDVDTFSSIHGEGQVRVNNDGSYNVFALEGVNGLAAFSGTIEEEPVAELPSNLFFSEYIEGSSNNKALEIFNNTDSTIALANYRIEQSSNGGGWEFYFEFAEGASIEGGGTYVLITDQVDATLFATENADEVLGFPSPIHFNGNDARALIHINPATADTTRLDVFGDPDSDTNWDVAGVVEGAREHTLLRKPSVTAGNPTPLASFGTNADDSEWIVNDQDDFSNLGEPTPEVQPLEPLAGDYYIPQGANAQGFASLGEAVNALNEVGLASAATFYIAEDLDETTSVIKISRDDLTEMNGLTIKPAPGTSPTITVSANNTAEDENEGVGFLILNSNWVTIDGSNEPGGNTRDLTITSSDELIGGNGLVSVYGASANNTIKNTNITYTGTATATAGIRARRNNADTGGIVNLLIENNTIGSESTPYGDGLRLWGTQTNPNNTSVVDNDIYANHRGITTFWNLDNVYDGNSIWIVNPREDQGFYAGIYLVLTSGETLIQNNEFKALAVNRTESAAYAGGIVFNATLGPHMVVNNTFAVPSFENTGSATGNSAYGIVLNNAAGSSNNTIYHNTFRMSSSADTGNLAAVGIEGVESTAQTWSFMNNLFSVEHDASDAYAYYWPVMETFESNYNNFDIAASAAVAQFGTDRFDTLTDWQALDVDGNSSEADVEFVSATNLRLAGASIGDDNLAGTPLVSVTTDIDGTTRSELAPYKGAFEGNVELSGDINIGTFALLSPDDGTLLELMSGDPDTEIVISWEEPVSAEAVTYTWHADSVGNDFSDPLLSIQADENGTATTLTLDFQTIDVALAARGVNEGETAELIWTVTAEADAGVRFANEPFDLSITRNLGVSNELSEDPKQFTLSQNYPNPFNPTSTIEFTLPASVEVRLEVYNISGQLVSTLVDSRMSAGQHSVVFDASNLASGVYLYRIRAGNFMETKQMTLIK
ncbi:lamin tail domain-containing protein [Rhodohalobacter sp. 8-1]|uniref:lamin tail domain-containing protein n=1 Tax=Rhodohalobacter sp. 8-1 TaxID=3131972 RepID=UPI0030EEB49C